MRITSRGQVTIPEHIRERDGLLPGVDVEFVEDGDAVKIIPRITAGVRGDRLIPRLRGTADAGLSTDEILTCRVVDNKPVSVAYRSYLPSVGPICPDEQPG